MANKDVNTNKEYPQRATDSTRDSSMGFVYAGPSINSNNIAQFSGVYAGPSPISMSMVYAGPSPISKSIGYDVQNSSSQFMTGMNMFASNPQPSQNVSIDDSDKVFCPNCGSGSPKTAKFCHQCGSKL